MSGVRADVDLSRLSRERPAAAIKKPRRSWRRFVLPFAILIGFAGLLLWSLGDAFRSRIEVSLVRPRLDLGRSSAAQSTKGASGATVTSAAFAAAGWVEPDPFPIQVRPLTQGVVERVLVQEGDSVKKDQVVAELIAIDTRLEVEEAKSLVSVAQGEHKERAVALDFAKRDFDARIALDERLAVAKAEVEGKIAERDALAASAAKLAADVEAASEELEVQRELRKRGAGGPRQVELAEARVESAKAAQLAAKAKAEHAKAQVDVAKAREHSAQRDAELRIEDRRRVEAAKAALATAVAKLAKARASLALVELRHERRFVRAPQAGIVLSLHAEPGQRVGDDGVCSLYDPSKLRVRVDVAQEQIELARVGQRASILAKSRPNRPYAGEVLRVVHSADIQKVTLEVQVRVVDPDTLLRPETLCQVRFAAGNATAPKAGTKGEASASTHVAIPKRLVQNAAVWLLDPDGPRAARRSVTLGREFSTDGGEVWVEVQSGVDASDKLLDAPSSPLTDGAPITVRGGVR